MVVSAVEHSGEVPSFADRLGERLVVAQPSGALLEYLFFHPELASAPFFEPAVKARLKRLSNFRHAAYARAARVQRDAQHGNRLALVSSYTPGRRLADMLVFARRGSIRPRVPAVLSLARQLMTGVALLHDYAPDVFHGAIGPERLIVAPDGRLVITEYVFGEAVEQAISEWGAVRLWREYRLATLSDTSLTRFGRRLDLVQIGLVTLALLLGRPLANLDYPQGLSQLIDAAEETIGDGEAGPLGGAFKDWLRRTLYIEPASAFRTLIEAQKAFGRMVEEEPRYGVSSVAVEAFFHQCEEASLLPGVPDLEPLDAAPADPPQESLPPLASQAPASIQESPEPGNDQVAPAPTPGRDAQAAMPGEDDTRQATGISLPETALEPPAANDPFCPWPVVAGSDAAATLFETFRPQGPVRDSHVVSIPDVVPPQDVPSAATALASFDNAAGQEERRAPAAQPEAMVPAGVRPSPEPQSDAASDWMGVVDSTAARQLRETLAEPVTPVGQEGRGQAGVDPGPGFAPEVSEWTEAILTSTHEWGSHPAAPPEPDLQSQFQSQFQPQSQPQPQFQPQVESMAAPAGTAPASPVELRPGEPAVGSTTPRRRATAVLSYDQVHQPVAKKGTTRWLLMAGVAVVLVVLAALGGPRLWSRFQAPDHREGAGVAAEGASETQPGEAGGFRITTQPAGGRITIDGKPRGTAPLRVADLAPGLHSITVETEWGTVDEAVTVEAGKVTPLSLSTIGWLKVAAPVELFVSEQGRNYGSTGGGPVMVPAGRHHFDLVNQGVAVRLRQFVDVPPGRTVTVPVELPAGMINLSSDQPAQVLLDGQMIGETPLLSMPAPLGSHEVVFRSPKYGDISYTVNVTLNAPVRLSVSFAKR